MARETGVSMQKTRMSKKDYGSMMIKQQKNQLNSKRKLQSSFNGVYTK